ncbi:MAG: allophanate hydrolase subunit 1 [Gemmataceae bacterium]|nr:allophanate hydrolase subunit 1 [Gemmataceae bacterium]
MRIEPLGDQAALAYCADENEATRLTAAIRRAMPAWCVDVVQAYTSVATYYDITLVDFTRVTDWLAAIPLHDATAIAPGSLHLIPCCYEFGLDFKRIEKQTGLSREAIIVFHTGSTYTVYSIGFCPGFPYLGYLPPELTGVPRLESPRLRVEEGSVGLTGRQTGIYTEARPGGWNIVGQTPLQLVDVRDAYFPLQTGDRVVFRQIDEREFRALRGERLSVPSDSA